MTDYFESRKKLVQGRDWRGDIEIEIDGETYEWTVRQLQDDEFYDVVADIDRDKLSAIDVDVDKDDLDEYRELSSRDDLTEEEEERLDELEDVVEDATVIDNLDRETFEAIRRAGIYGAVPSAEDVDYVMQLGWDEHEDMFGERIQSREEAYTAVKNDMQEMLRDATDFVSLKVGMKVLEASLDTEEDEGN